MPRRPDCWIDLEGAKNPQVWVQRAPPFVKPPIPDAPESHAQMRQSPMTKRAPLFWLLGLKGASPPIHPQKIGSRGLGFAKRYLGHPSNQSPKKSCGSTAAPRTGLGKLSDNFASLSTSLFQKDHRLLIFSPNFIHEAREPQ